MHVISACPNICVDVDTACVYRLLPVFGLFAYSVFVSCLHVCLLWIFGFLCNSCLITCINNMAAVDKQLRRMLNAALSQWMDAAADLAKLSVML